MFQNSQSQPNNGNAVMRQRGIIDHLIPIIGLVLVYAGCMLIFSFLPWMHWIDCALYAAMVMIAAVGVIGFWADYLLGTPPTRQPDFLARPQRSGLLFKVEAPSFSLTLDTRQAMAY